MLAGLLALVMLFSLLPATALAVTAAGTASDSTASGEPSFPYLNQEDHAAYIVGDSDGLVHPERNITRAEVATIFYRLLTDETRAWYWTEDNSFPDVSSGDWYNTAISTLSNLGVLNGKPDGGFHPNDNITRAEFAAVAVRFFENTEGCVWTRDAFSDIAGHWASESINLAYLLGIVGGYPDGTYHPDSVITRAEAMTIVNNTLGRTPGTRGIEPVEKDMITWPDNMDKSKWYYAAVQEATNSHEYTNGSEGEVWTALLPAPDWTALEKEWADAASGKTEDGGNSSTPPVIPDPQPGGSTETTLHDTATGAAVEFGSAPVTNMTVEPATVTALEGKTYVAYDITPYNTDGTKYTNSATVTLPLTEELKSSDLLSGFVVEDDGRITYIPGTRVGDSYTFTTPHFSTVGIVDNVVTLNVGGQPVTHEDTTGNYENDVDTTKLDESIATVEVQGTDSTETTTYTAVSVTCNTLISGNSTTWKATNYYYQANDGEYYPVYAKRSANGNNRYDYTWGYSKTASADEVTEIKTQTRVKASATVTITIYNKSTSTVGTPSTAIIFTGVGPGTTTVTVGGTTYTINVYEQKTVTLAPKGIHTFHGAPGESPLPLDNTVAKAELDTNDKRLTITGKTEGQTEFTEGFIEYTVEVKENIQKITLKVGESKTFESTATDITGAGTTGDYEDSCVAATLSDGTSAVAAIATFALVDDTDTSAAALSDDSSGTITFTGVAPGTTTVTAGDTTYEVTVTADEGDDSGTTTDTTSTIVYYPVTLYNYDQTTINNATHQTEMDAAKSSADGIESLTQWNGIYFGSGLSSAAYTEEISIENGTYIFQNARAAANDVGSWLVGTTEGITSTTNQSDATQWTIQSNGDGTYTLNSTNGYMTISGSGTGNAKTAEASGSFEIVGYSGSTYTGCIQLKSNGYYLCQWGSTTAVNYGGYNVNNDGGNAFYLYKVTDSGTEQVTFTTTESLSYAVWNSWTKGQDNSYGQFTYSGLVESTLDADKNIRFTKPEGGLFNDDATVKDIYTNVEAPFLYDSETGFYSFNSSINGAYFKADATQGSTVAQSNGRLYFDEGNTQTNSGSYGDGSTTVWMPFNSGTSLTESSGQDNSCDYYFGMKATVPFSMTANGRVNPNDDTSKEITFTFSGDDDIWIFIDGQLVIDLGGIHNRLDSIIDFAANTVTYSVSNNALASLGDAANMLFSADDGWTSETGTLTNASGTSGTYTVKYTHKLFNDGDGTGIINQTRETFSASDSHDLTVFYLERGAGSSNCQLYFNLPMKDTVSVTKRATQSISSDGTLSPLTAKEQETVNNIDFGFTLTKNGEPVANTNYSLLNADGQVISTPSTDANGHFTLRNGQTAKFVGEMSAEQSQNETNDQTSNSATYQVIEDAVESKGFKLPTYTYSGTAADGFTVGSTDYSKGSDIPATKESLTSSAVTVLNDSEQEDSVVFVCENYFDANLPNPSSRPVDDRIVIDYGLSVVIDVLANDIYRGDTIEITEVTGAQYGTAAIEDGKIKYQLTKQLCGVEVLTYTAKVTGTGNSGTETVTKTESNTAQVYIIPATSMYYEENFSDMVTFTGAWSDVGTAQTAPQETGVVGTVGDSPYGSDAAYLYDSGDSNGSSKYVNTSSAAASFSYTFTGTGTSFFARIDSDSAVISVSVTDAEGNSWDYLTRNTKYVSADGTDVGTLYNIPVYTIDGLNYDTYTVEVTVLKAVSVLHYGASFYLDGIRVINPLFDLENHPGELSELEQIAQAAYATDGEANMAIATLRQKLLGEASINEDGTLSWNGGDFVLFTDSNGATTSAEEYKSNGPKEEVYLNNGQSVSFSLYGWDANTNKIYLGIKAPVGSGSVSIDGNTLNINNATDCYYDISSYANITTDEDGVTIATFEVRSTSSLISVTNIKVTGNAQFIIVQQEDKDVDGDTGGDDETTSETGEPLAEEPPTEEGGQE